ncbi:MAG: serine hydrolase domain-containing protein [Agrobacterium sp.]|nr:serine hydrolase domain-containing protein [Agrobacterium sp.]
MKNQQPYANLMSHQAGVRHYRPLWLPPFNEYLLNKPFLTVEEGLLLFKDDPRIATPGEEFHYSSYGINLASAVTEQAANRTFLQLMRQEIFDPLDMTHTYGEKESNPKGTQWYQLRSDGKASLTAPVNSSYKWASGGFMSTPTDLVKLGNSWITLKLFSDETRQLFFTPQTLANGDINPQSYALGWRVEQKKIEQIKKGEVDVRIVHHGGTAQGSSAFLVIFPEYELVIAATMNGLSENFGVLSNICFSAAGMYLAQANN